MGSTIYALINVHFSLNLGTRNLCLDRYRDLAKVDILNIKILQNNLIIT